MLKTYNSKQNMKNLHLIFFSLLLSICSCSQAQTLADPIPAHDTFQLNSVQLKEMRTLNIWIPEGSKKEALPVLYMPDGGIKEDFPHIANTLAQLVNDKKIKPVMLVGIENTERRRDLTGFTAVAKDREIAPVVGGSDQFRDFIREELIPEIDKRYTTTAERGIIGESLAGLFVVETLMTSPDLFDFYIAFDPSLWWNNQELVKSAPEHLKKMHHDGKKKFWFAGSKARDIAKVTKVLSEKLQQSAPANLQWHYSPEPREQHHTIFRATKEKALIWTLNPQQ